MFGTYRVVARPVGRDTTKEALANQSTSCYRAYALIVGIPMVDLH